MLPQLVVIAEDVALTTYCAHRGLQVWRSELKGRVDFDLSRRLLVCIYELREAIRRARNPFMSSGEIAAARDAFAPNSGDTARDGCNTDVAVYSLRWRGVVEQYHRLQAELIEAEAIWDTSARQSCEALITSMWDLRTAIHRKVVLNRRERLMQSSDRADDWSRDMEKVDAILEDCGDEENPDEYAKRLKEAVAEAEQYLRARMAGIRR